MAKRRQLFDAQDDVDKKRAELINEIERQLQTKTSIEPVFTLRWTLGDGAGTRCMTMTMPGKKK